MNQHRSIIRTTAALTLLLVLSSSASAQATRTWVSGVGDDANPGSRTAPCKTFAGAISKTAIGGEIDCLDPGGFGAVTITKAITIDGSGTFASILGSGTNGIVINAGANDVVTIRNLSINGAGSGLNGIRFIAGGALHIENCEIFNFSQKGIDFEPSGSSKLFVKDTIILNNNNAVNGGAIFILPGASGSADASLEGVTLKGNTFGLLVGDRVKASVRNSVAASNSNQGFIASGSTGPISLNLESSESSNNGSIGIRNATSSATSIIRMSNVTVMNNATGLSANGAGIIRSFGNNRIDGNNVDGAPTTTKAQQ